jgi:hypothetical protein
MEASLEEKSEQRSSNKKKRREMEGRGGGGVVGEGKDERGEGWLCSRKMMLCA